MQSNFAKVTLRQRENGGILKNVTFTTLFSSLDSGTNCSRSFLEAFGCLGVLFCPQMARAFYWLETLIQFTCDFCAV